MINDFTFKNLKVWQESILLAKRIYKLTKTFPKDEMYGLTSQLRRAVTSISLNIAEGRGKYSRKDFIKYLYQARGSLFEVITCIELSCELEMLNNKIKEELLIQSSLIQRLLSGLIKSIKEKDEMDSQPLTHPVTQSL